MSKRSERRARQQADKAKLLAANTSQPGQAMPPGKGAPASVFPIAVEPTPGALAPAPINDRFPTVVGSAVTLSYCAAVFRLASTGYRLQYVDLLNELLEQDPHLYSVVTKRILSSAVGRVEIVPCNLPEGHPDTQAANELAAFVEAEIGRIPDLGRSLTELLWAVFHGLSAQEIYWSRDSDGWHVDRLGFVHSRRLAYPDYQSWSLHVWDQGQVYGWQSAWGTSPTNSNIFGLRIADYPGKFIVHTPQLRGDYPTRDGIGRQMATWALFKRIGGRGASEYLERFAKPLMDVSWSTVGDDGKPRGAAKEEIDLAAQIAASIGPGSGSYASHPDTIAVKPITQGAESAKFTWQEWIQLCNSEMSKAALGGTLGTDVGRGGGNRSLGEVQERGEIDLEKYDASRLADSIRRDLISWIVRLNKPDQLRLLPQVRIHIDPDPDPTSILTLAKQLTDMGAPVDMDATAYQVGIALVEAEEGAPARRSFKSDIATVIKTLTQVDYPVDLDAVAQMTGIPIVALKDMATARRSRVVVAGPATAGAVEPDRSDDPNDPNFETPPEPTEPDGVPSAEGAEPTDASATEPAADSNAVTVRTHVRKKPAVKPKPPAPTPQDEEKTTLRINAASRFTLLLSDRSDKAQAKAVFDLLAEDYPKNRLDWILAGHWQGPVEIPIDQIDFSSSHNWRASHEDVTPYANRIQQGRRKPVVLVKTPGNPKYIIVDGHHRTLASKQLGIPVLAYVSKVHVDNGPWDELHAAQKKGSSKGDSVAAASYLPEHPAKMKGEAADPADTFRATHRARRFY